MTFPDPMRSALDLARAGSRSQAWQLARSVLDTVGHDRSAALGFAELLAIDPGYPDAIATAERVVLGFASDPEVIIALSASLLRVAEQRPPDEPPFEKGPAHLAAGAAQRCFEGLPATDRRAAAWGGYLQINLADALRMMGPDHDADALQAYQLALAIDDTNGWWWFQLGLLHKWRGRFREALAANQKALARLSHLHGPTPTGALPILKPVLWNLAIAATALGEGPLALEAWERLGIRGSLSGAGLPFIPDMPPMQLRVATLGEEIGRNDPLPPRAVSFELVWVQPLSPCHGVVQSPTVRKASVDYGDVVLWDGAPVHMTEIQGRSVPVFPLLWVLRASDEHRFRFVGMEQAPRTIDSVAAELGDGVELAIFDRRSPASGGNTIFYGKLLITAEVDLVRLREKLETAVRARPGLTLSVPGLHEKIGDTQATGKAHQAWGGIERAGEKLGLLPRN